MSETDHAKRIWEVLRQLLVVASLILLVAWMVTGQYWLIVLLGGGIGIVLAEHWARTGLWQLTALLLIPTVFASLATVIVALSGEPPPTIAELLTAAAIGAATGVVPAACSVVVILLASSVPGRLTSIDVFPHLSSKLKYARSNSEGSSPKSFSNPPQ